MTFKAMCKKFEKINPADYPARLEDEKKWIKRLATKGDD